MLRRHYTSCKTRQRKPIPRKVASGPPKKACDRCAARKAACHSVGSLGCRRCQLDGVDCTMFRKETNASSTFTLKSPSTTATAPISKATTVNNETPVPHNLDEPRSSDFHNIFLPTAVHEALNYSNAETYASTLLHSRSVLPSLSSENQKHEEHHPENDGEINNEFLPTKEGLPDTFLASPPSILMGKEHSLDLAQFIQNEFSEPINHLTKRTSNFIDDLAYLRMQFSLHDLPVSLIWETSRETSRSFLSIFPYINATPAAQLTFNGLDILQPTMHQNWLYTSSFLVQRGKLKTCFLIEIAYLHTTNYSYYLLHISS